MKYDQRTKLWTHISNVKWLTHKETTWLSNDYVHIPVWLNPIQVLWDLAGIWKVARLDSCIRVAWVLTKCQCWLKIPVLIDHRYAIFHVCPISCMSYFSCSTGSLMRTPKGVSYISWEWFVSPANITLRSLITPSPQNGSSLMTPPWKKWVFKWMCWCLFQMNWEKCF